MKKQYNAKTTLSLHRETLTKLTGELKRVEGGAYGGGTTLTRDPLETVHCGPTLYCGSNDIAC